MQDFKSTRIITPRDMDIYGKSPTIQNLVELLNGENIPDSESNQNVAVLARNHLMVMISFGNATRASNLININLRDVKNATKENDFDAWAISSKSYKTSLLYGEKKILLGEDLYHQVQNYVQFLRPRLIVDHQKRLEKRPLFASVRSTEMTHSSISNGMTNIFTCVKEFSQDERYVSIKLA